MPRMRSIKDTAKLFKEMDPDTEITERTLRQMISEGTIPTVKTGVKHLINVDMLIDMLNSPVDGMSKVSGFGNMVAIEK